MHDILPIVKTPFEKSLSLRIEHACSILEIVSASQIYEPKGEMDATDGLQKALESYSQLNTKFFNVFEKYYKATTDRRSLIKGASQSVKRTAQLINQSVSSDLTIQRSQRKQLSALYSKIYSENHLNAPYDFSKPSRNKDMSTYFHSNQIILDCFKQMVSQLSTYTLVGPSQHLSLTHCYLLISEMEMFETEINLLVNKLHILNSGRLIMLDQVLDRCRSISNRSRFIFGAGSPDYRLLKKHKLSVK